MEVKISGENKIAFKEIRKLLYEIYDLSLPEEINFEIDTDGWRIQFQEVTRISDQVLVYLVQNMESESSETVQPYDKGEDYKRYLGLSEEDKDEIYNF